MAEYIAREALLKAYLGFALAKSKAEKARRGAAYFQGDLFPMVELTEKEWVSLINAAPAADVVEVKHGRWEDASDLDGVVCSVCGEDFCVLTNENERFNFCPNCGADMQERKEGEGDEDR